MTTTSGTEKKPVKKTAAVFILITVVAVALLFETVSLSMANDELSAKLQEATQANDALKDNLESLGYNYTALVNSVGIGLPAPPVATRLGMKLEKASYAEKVMLWVTGEVENTGNRTLYNVRLRFELNGGDETQDYVIGVLEAYETVTVRTSIWSRFSTDVEDWKMITTATYTP